MCPPSCNILASIRATKWFVLVMLSCTTASPPFLLVKTPSIRTLLTFMIAGWKTGNLLDLRQVMLQKVLCAKKKLKSKQNQVILYPQRALHIWKVPDRFPRELHKLVSISQSHFKGVVLTSRLLILADWGLRCFVFRFCFTIACSLRWC